jgi:hypothetical protein
MFTVTGCVSRSHVLLSSPTNQVPPGPSSAPTNWIACNLWQQQLLYHHTNNQNLPTPRMSTTTSYTRTHTHQQGTWGRRGDYQLSLHYLDEALSFIASEWAWYAVQRDCGVERGTGCRGRWRWEGGGRGRKLCLRRLPSKAVRRRGKSTRTTRMRKRTPCSHPTHSISARSVHTHATSHHYLWHPTPPRPYQHLHHQSPLFLHTPFLRTPHHPAAHCRHAYNNLRIQPMHAPAIFADAQAVPNSWRTQGPHSILPIG